MYHSGKRCYVIAGWLSIGCQVGRTACVCPMARLWFCDLPIVGWFPAGMVISRMPKRNTLHGARCLCLGSQQCSSCYIFISPYLVSRVSHTLYNASRSLIRSLQYPIVGHRSRPSFHNNARYFAIALATKTALGNIASSNDCEIIFSSASVASVGVALERELHIPPVFVQRAQFSASACLCSCPCSSTSWFLDGRRIGES